MQPTSHFSRRRFLRLGAAALVAAPAALGAWAWCVEPFRVEVVERPLPVANLPEHLTNELLVQFSDLHIGPEVDDDFLLGAFELIRPLAPAFVVMTGDFMTCRRLEEI